MTNSSNQFADLVAALGQEFGDVVGLHSPSLHEPTVVDFDVDGVLFTMVYSPKERPLHIASMCHFGLVPEDNEAAVMRQLLELNLAMAGHVAWIGIDAVNGEVMLATHVRLRDVTPRHMIDTMRAHSRLAREWREGFFLRPAYGEATS